jgi:hypothetical protein
MKVLHGARYRDENGTGKRPFRHDRLSANAYSGDPLNCSATGIRKDRT